MAGQADTAYPRLPEDASAGYWRAQPCSEVHYHQDWPAWVRLKPVTFPRGVGRLLASAVASLSGQRHDQHHWLRLSERTAWRQGGGPTEHDQAASPHPLPGPRQPADMRSSRLRDDDLPTDAELLQRHVDGDPDAFGLLFHRHRDRLWAVAIRTLGDPEEAADALQDAMIAAFRRASSFRGDSAVTTWLHRIVVNAALDRMRRRAARPTTSGQDDEALDALAAVAGSRPLSDPSGTTDTSMDVMAALRRLVPDQQAALVLVDMLGYSIADAAEVLGVSEGTVKSRAARGRARLVPQLAHLRPAAGTDEETGNRTARPRVQPAQEGGDDAL